VSYAQNHSLAHLYTDIIMITLPHHVSSIVLPVFTNFTLTCNSALLFRYYVLLVNNS